MTDLCLLYTTCPDQLTAEALGHTLVTEGLVACANLLPGMRSIYPWQGRIETADEVVVLFKVTSEGVQRAAERLRNLHPYQTPCILQVPVTWADPVYAAWVTANVRCPDLGVAGEIVPEPK